jgi:sulfatase modifying factor 1
MFAPRTRNLPANRPSALYIRQVDRELITIDAPRRQTIDAPPGMVWIPAGTTMLGSDVHYPEESPAHAVTVDGFFLDLHPVTNLQFAEFVDATGYRTLAERAPDPADYPGVDPSQLVPASAVFDPPTHPDDLGNAYQWWFSVDGADGRHPEGPDSDLTCKIDHPVTHLAWEDVRAYATWAGKSLPSEAEWEYAARGGLHGAEFAWGSELTPSGRHMANVWQGDFPVVNDMDDGYFWTSPVGAFDANGYGLFDMIGNVWEWTADWWSTHRPAPISACCAAAGAPMSSAPAGDARSSGVPVSPAPAGGVPVSPAPAGARQAAVNPTGGTELLSVDLMQPIPLRKPRKVIKGGSFLCAPNYCQRYRPAARLAQAVDTSTCHLGFRCAVRP